MAIYIGTDGNDTLTGLDDVYDELTGGLGDDVLIGGGGGIKGYDWAHYDTAPSAVTVNLSTGTASGGDGNDTLNGIEGVTGSIYNDTLTGSNYSGSSIWGGKGDDLLIAGDGDAIMQGGSGNNILQGGKGFDSAYYSDASSSVTVNLSTGTASSSGSNDTLSSIEAAYGSAYNDNFTGNDLDNYLYGLDGNDVLAGGNGNDRLYGGNGKDILQGGAGDDWLDGGSGNDSLLGGSGNDTLSGGFDGDDKLTGGTGIDNFLFNTSPGEVDTITDFTVADDTIQLDNSWNLYSALRTEGILTADKFVIGKHALDANDFIIYNNVTGTLLYDKDGSGSATPLTIAIIGTGLAMTNADFVVI